MKILITGAKGQLGKDIIKVLKKKGHSFSPIDLPEIDITNETQIHNYILHDKPEIVLHCAAFTAVDAAEDDAETCRKVNALGTGYIAKACKVLDIPMVYISTDYVFNGQGTTPWKPEDIPAPLSVYGKTKYEGECLIKNSLEKYFIIRTSWVFGLGGNNFVKTMLKLSESHKEVNVVNDQIGSPTYTADLAELVVKMAESNKYGIYHASNSGFCSWYEFALEIFKLAGKRIQVNPVTSQAFKSKAKRPENSRMDQEKLEQQGFGKMPAWQDALQRFLKELTEEGA